MCNINANLWTPAENVPSHISESAPCCPGRPLLPRLHWGTWLSPPLSSCTHLWQSERGTSCFSKTPQPSSAAGTQRTTHSHPFWSPPSSGGGGVSSSHSIWQSNYVLEFSRCWVNPLLTMVGKQQTHELSAWFSAFLCLSTPHHTPTH